MGGGGLGKDVFDCVVVFRCFLKNKKVSVLLSSVFVDVL